MNAEDVLDPRSLSLAELREMRNKLQNEDDEVSYVRRVAQARVDLVRALVRMRQARLDQLERGVVPRVTQLDRAIDVARGHELLDLGEEVFFFFCLRMRNQRWVGFGFFAQQDVHGGVAAIIENHVGWLAIGPFENLGGVFPVVLQAFAFDGKHGNARCSNGGGGVILRRENVAGRPTNVSAQGFQCFNQHGGLNGHVQRTGYASTLQRLRSGVFSAGGHQTWHFNFSHIQLFAAPISQLNIGNNVVVLAHVQSSSLM